MPLEYDSHTNQIRYDGRVVGRYECKDGIARVTLNLTYECPPRNGSCPYRGSLMDFLISLNTNQEKG